MPMMSTDVEPSGTVNLIVVDVSVVPVYWNWTSSSPTITVVMLSIIAFGSVSSTSPALSNITLTVLSASIVAVVALEVADLPVTTKLWPSIVAVVLNSCGYVVPPADVTITVPTMFGWSAQKYGNSPASSNVWLNVCPGAHRGLKFGEESNALPLSGSSGPVPDVTVCAVESLLVHVTVSPTLMFIGLGSKASVVLLDEPGVAIACTSAAKAGVNVDICPSTTARTAANPTATAILELINYFRLLL